MYHGVRSELHVAGEDKEAVSFGWDGTHKGRDAILFYWETWLDGRCGTVRGNAGREGWAGF